MRARGSPPHPLNAPDPSQGPSWPDTTAPLTSPRPAAVRRPSAQTQLLAAQKLALQPLGLPGPEELVALVTHRTLPECFFPRARCAPS